MAAKERVLAETLPWHTAKERVLAETLPWHTPTPSARSGANAIRGGFVSRKVPLEEKIT